jgi:hypothetical protein
MRRVVCLTAIAVVLASAPWAQGQDRKSEIEKKLDAQFKLTKLTADGSDIVTAGSIVVLHKDGFIMAPLDNEYPPTNTYANGSFSMGFASTVGLGHFIKSHGDVASSTKQRKFVADEKFFITSIKVNDDGLILGFYSDPYSDVRYHGQMKFPFKHGVPPPDDVVNVVAEAVTVAPADKDSAAADAAPAAPAAPAPAAAPAAAIAPIAPPPPPADAPPPAPKTIKIGQTRDEVVAAFGQPTKIIKLATKEIDTYPDMKVTFVHNKVSDVQ